MSEEVRGQLARVILSSPMWVPGLELRSSANISPVLNHIFITVLENSEVHSFKPMNERCVLIDRTELEAGRPECLRKSVPSSTMANGDLTCLTLQFFHLQVKGESEW